MKSVTPDERGLYLADKSDSRKELELQVVGEKGRRRGSFLGLRRPEVIVEELTG